jgi:predicted membrane chloride channel (bestrophin family)
MSTFLAPTFKRIKNHVFANVFVTTLVYMAYLAFPKSLLLKGIPVAPHLLLGNALGLLLVFRTNSAYDRFWEARKIWGAMISRIRILAHFAHRSLYGAEREHVLTLCAAMPAVFLHHLRGWNRLPKQQDQVDFLVQALGEDDAIVSWHLGKLSLKHQTGCSHTLA